VRRLLRPIPLLVLACVAGLFVLLAYGIASNEPDTALEEALGRGEREEAPDLELPWLSKKGTGSLADYRGQVVVLNYWASWCEPCREESPLLERWHRRMKRERGTVLGVDTLDVTTDAEEFIREYRLTYPMLRDGDGETHELFGIVGYPETIVIDREGRIAALRRGPVDEEFMREAVAPLLKEDV
jgi:cytochrome c biogenesis protein CcmG, thiol:disulfide interchange protein DsbE